MTTLAKILIGLLLSATSCSCSFVMDGVVGKGPVQTRNIDNIEDFDAIEVSRGLEVILDQYITNSIRIEANENLMELIQVSVEDNTLKITSEKNIFSADAKKVYVKFDNVSRIKAASGSEITSNGIIKEKNMKIHSSSGATVKVNLKSDQLFCNASSGATIKLDGFANTMDATSSSGATINTKNVATNDVTANASSGSTITVHSKGSFKGDASSGSSIRYSGNPEVIYATDSSGGHIHKI